MPKRVKHNAPMPPSVNAYVNHKCRCAGCKAAWAKYFRSRREVTIVADNEDRLAELIADKLAKKLQGDESASNKAMNDAMREVLRNDPTRGEASVDSVFGPGPEYETDSTGSKRLKKQPTQREKQ